MATFTERIIRAAKLDTRLYEEVEADEQATMQAMAVVLLSSVAAGVGAPGRGPGWVLVVGIVALVSWFIWAYLTYWIGTRLLPEASTHADHGQLLRTMGFASAPGLVRVLGVFPGFGPIVFLGAGIWMLVATVVAVRQALDYRSTWRAVGVCAIGWVVHIVVLRVAVWLLLGSRAPA